MKLQERSPSQSGIWPALATMIVTQALVVMASLALPVLAPIAAESFGISASYVGLYASVIFLGALASTLVTSALVIRFGALRISQLTLLFAAAGLLFLLGNTPWMLMVSALLIGFAYGPSNPASSRLLSRFTKDGSRSAIFSIKQTSVPLGGAIAGLFFPLLATLAGWQMAVFLAAFLCLVTGLAVQPWRRELDADRIRGRSARSDHLFSPLLTVLVDAKLRYFGTIAFCFAALQFTFSAVFVTYLVEKADLDSVAAGMVLSISLVTSVLARVVWGLFADRFRGPLILNLLGLLMAGAGLVSIAITPNWPYWSLVGLGAWFGLAAYSWNGVYLASVADASVNVDVATATSGTMFLVFAGALVGPALFTALYALTNNYAAGFAILSLVTASAAMLTFKIP